MPPLNCAVFGAGGYGAAHLEAVESLEQEGLLSLRAVAEAFPERARESLDRLRSRGVRVYEDYRRLLDEQTELELVGIATPIHLHLPMAVDCFGRGLHVMLEKPPAPLVQQVDQMLESAARNGLRCQVGFQSVTDPTACELKRLLASGAIGPVTDILVEGYWRRTDGYYARAPWAGRLRVEGHWVLDGPLNNPLCHYVHEALFFASPEPAATARPLTLRAELYRAHPIQGEDTVCARAELEGGVTLHTYLTLCAPEHNAPIVTIRGRSGRASWTPGRYQLEGPEGHREQERARGRAEMLYGNLARHVLGEEDLLSPLSATRNVILHNNGCYASAGKIRRIPEDRVRRYASEREGEDGEVATEVTGLPSLLKEASAGRRLFSEMGVEWAVETPTVGLDFDDFDPGFLVA